MKDTEGYIAEVGRVKEAFRGRLEIYLGCEEDAFSLVDRGKYEYLVGSSHYYFLDGKYLPIDSSYDYFSACYAAFSGNTREMARVYYENFVSYIQKRRPDIIGHFDLITKFDEYAAPVFLSDPEYRKNAEFYLREAARAHCLFEVNTGAITRGYRVTPYPHEDLLRVLRECDEGIILSSDSHAIETLDGCFEETRKYLIDLGFRHAYTLEGGEFVRYALV